MRTIVKLNADNNNVLQLLNFPLIFRWNSEKYKEGKEYTFYLDDRPVGSAKLVHTVRFTLPNLTDGMALLACAMTSGRARLMFQRLHKDYVAAFGDKAFFGFYIFKWTKKNSDERTDNRAA